MAVSGFAALGYQLVWTHQFGLWLGHEITAVLAVLAAFFGGLALGAWRLGEPIARSKHPVRWYAVCEAVIALWALLLTWVLPDISALLSRWAGPTPTPLWHWGIAFGGSFALLLPATCAMGATLPAMDAIVSQVRTATPQMGWLYAANTLGAVLGVLGSVFWLIPSLGFNRTAWVCAGLSGLCAALAWKAFGTTGAPGGAPVRNDNASHQTAPQRPISGLAILFATGLLGIGYEVVAIRVASQVTENTVYTFALLLAVYLLATASGAAHYQKRWANGQALSTAGDRLLVLLSASVLLGMAALHQSERIVHGVANAADMGFFGALLAEGTLAVAVLALPSWLMGAVFCHLCNQAKTRHWPLGSALGLNTLGCALAPLVFGVILVPAMGATAVLVVIAAAYLALVSAQQWRGAITWAVAATCLVAAIWTPRLAFVDVPSGGQLLSYADGALASVSVVQDAAGVRRLHINNRQQEGSSATGLADARLAYLPMLLHPSPGRALFLGLGTGVTAHAAAQNPLVQVDAVELLPQVISASAFFQTESKAVRQASVSTENPRILQGDARRFARAGTSGYDVIVADLFHPARSGAGALYTREHFAALRQRLSPNGVVCQWLPLHQLDLTTLASIVQAFMAVYPGAYAVLANNSLDTPVLGLVAKREPGGFLASDIHQALAEPTGKLRRAALGFKDDYALLGSFVAGPQALKAFAGHAPVNTDDHPVVAQRAPLVLYQPEAKPRERLAALLTQLSITPQDLSIDARLAPDMAARLAAYWQARDGFIRLGLTVKPSSDPRNMIAQLQAPLTALVRSSPDFAPAYEPLLAMAKGVQQSDPALAASIMKDLAQAVHRETP